MMTLFDLYFIFTKTYKIKSLSMIKLIMINLIGQNRGPRVTSKVSFENLCISRLPHGFFIRYTIAKSLTFVDKFAMIHSELV